MAQYVTVHRSANEQETSGATRLRYMSKARNAYSLQIIQLIRWCGNLAIDLHGVTDFGIMERNRNHSQTLLSDTTRCINLAEIDKILRSAVRYN